MEKEFHYSRYITIRRKAELANNVGLSERQVRKRERMTDSEKRRGERQKSNVCVIAECFCSHVT